jgi:hypothetical protein
MNHEDKQILGSIMHTFYTFIAKKLYKLLAYDFPVGPGSYLSRFYSVRRVPGNI